MEGNDRYDDVAVIVVLVHVLMAVYVAVGTTLPFN